MKTNNVYVILNWLFDSYVGRKCNKYPIQNCSGNNGIYMYCIRGKPLKEKKIINQFAMTVDVIFLSLLFTTFTFLNMTDDTFVPRLLTT